MTWRPYPYVAGWDETGPKVVRRGSVRFDRDIWMFCHKIVEMQLASRTMRQFGRVQIIPPTITPVSQSKALSGRRESRSIRSRFRSELINWGTAGRASRVLMERVLLRSISPGIGISACLLYSRRSLRVLQTSSLARRIESWRWPRGKAR